MTLVAGRCMNSCMAHPCMLKHVLVVVRWSGCENSPRVLLVLQLQRQATRRAGVHGCAAKLCCASGYLGGCLDAPGVSCKAWLARVV